MAHTIEAASSGRAKCRGCGKPIVKGELRFGERLPNPFADNSDMTLWFHIPCAAYRRPESLLEVIGEVPDNSQFREWIATGTTHHRLPRISGLDRAPSGRAKCRACNEMIAKDDWRVPLEFFEEGMFNPSGYIHLTCAGEYFGTTDILPRLAFFSALPAADLMDASKLLAG